ncbi:hypothetical protein [Streptomyces noursei]|nr:hypothetical protein [Streptomyces noursei]
MSWLADSVPSISSRNAWISVSAEPTAGPAGSQLVMKLVAPR